MVKILSIFVLAFLENTNFNTAIVVNPLERKLAKRTSLHFAVVSFCKFLSHGTWEASFSSHRLIFGGFFNPWDEEIPIPETRPIRKFYIYVKKGTWKNEFANFTGL